MNEKRKELLLQVRKHEDNAKLVWTCGTTWYCYQVNYQQLEAAASDVRKALMRLVDKFRSPSGFSYHDNLIELVKSGKALYQAVFLGIASSDEMGAARVQEYILAHGRASLELCCELSSSLHVPWGLVCEPQFDENQSDDKLIEGFWCFKHQLWARYRISYDNEHSPPQPQNAATFITLPLVHNEVYQQVQPLLSEEENRVLKALWAHQEPLTTFASFRERWGQLGNSSGLLYFYGHASASSLALSSDDELKANELRSVIQSQPGRSKKNAWLAFLNGCHTGSATLGAYGFLHATHQVGFHGFIGTEVAVPDVFALRFGMAVLIGLLYSEQCILSIMDRLRRAHAPLSLAYGLYCDPHFQVLGPTQSAPAWPSPGEDFSKLRATAQYRTR